LSDYIRYNSHIPYYVQLIDILTNQINRLEYHPGDRMAGEVELCKRYGVSRTVVRQALRELEHNGIIFKQKGRGTFVAGPKIHESLAQKLTGFYQDMTARGLDPTTQVLKHVVKPSDAKIARILEIPIGSDVFEIERLRFIKTEPIQLTTTYIPYSVCPNLEFVDLTNMSLYELLEKEYGLFIAKGTRYIEAVSANETESRLLGILKGAPLIRLESVSFLENGMPIEYYHAVHRGDRTRFEVELVRYQENGALKEKISEQKDTISSEMDALLKK